MAGLHEERMGANASPEALKRLFSLPRLSSEQGFESADSESRHGSTLAFESSLKCHETDLQSSSVEFGSTRVKSEITTETHLTPGNRSLERGMVKKKQRCRVVGGEDGLSTNTVVQDSQHGTESSCSNSLPVVVPVSYQSYQETSKDAYLFRNCGSSMDSSNFDRSPEEQVTASSESGVSARIASKARRNSNARNSMKIMWLGGNHSSSMIKRESRDLEEATPEEGQVLKHSDDVRCVSRERTMRCEMSGDGKSLETGSEVMNKCKDEFWVNESADSSMVKRCKKSVIGDDKAIAGFDLNKDLNSNEQDDCVQPVLPCVSSHSVIRVVAKAGIPSGRRPMFPLEFEGGLCWKGASKTSAFRSTKNSDGRRCSTIHGTKDLEGFKGIDLNVAVEEDIPAYGTPTEQAKSPLIDLNCLYESAEELSQPKLEKSPLVDLNLDTERSSNDHWLDHKNVEFPNFSKRDVYLSDLSSIRRIHNTGHSLKALPQYLQQMELVPRHILPTTSYFHEHGIFPGAYNAPHTGQFVHKQSTSSKMAAFAPKLEAKTKELLSTNGSKSEGLMYFPFLSNERMMHQDAWYAASLKRKEPPEGGLDCFHLGYKQLT
ncbi:uncharacterized protein LOC125217938 [Salvia hispanica]|uniref:uncharacterized protein LOC125217938 n=1 Tax=Salvia hispanica TaxID=49212 RepID=UPI002009A7A6|nr:uncharacterized protein LOC125217938 [Salvia hispanica]